MPKTQSASGFSHWQARRAAPKAVAGGRGSCPVLAACSFAAPEPELQAARAAAPCLLDGVMVELRAYAAASRSSTRGTRNRRRARASRKPAREAREGG